MFSETTVTRHHNVLLLTFHKNCDSENHHSEFLEQARKNVKNEIIFNNLKMKSEKLRKRKKEKKGKMKLHKESVQAIGSCLLYSTLSLSTTLTNKSLLTTYLFSFPFALLYWQYIVTTVLVVSAKLLGAISYPWPTRGAVARWLPLNALFCLMLVSNTYALRYISIPMVTVIKAISTVMTGLGDTLFFSQRLTPGIAASMAVMVLSSFVAGANDLDYNARGYFWAGLNSVSTTAYVLYMRRVLSTNKVSEFTAVFLNNALALPMMMPLLISRGELADVFRYFLGPDDINDGNAAAALEVPAGFAVMFVLNGLSGFALSLASFVCVKTTSPTTYSMVGSLNKIPLTFIGWLAFGASFTPLGVLSIIISLAGGVLYTYCKSMQKKSIT